MQSRRLFDAKYLDTETAQYISDASSFKNEHSGLSAANWLPISDPSLPSGPNPVKTVQQGFQAIPETMVQQFLDASSANRFHRNHHLRSISKNEDGNYVLTFQPTETQAGVTSDDKSASTKRACARKVVLAIPKLALQHLDWKGLKEDTVKDMLDNAVRDSPGAKMYFGYDDAWWRNLSLAAPFAVSTTPLRQTYDYAESKSTAKAVLNPSYTDMYMPFWEEIVRNGDFLPSTDTGDMSIAMSNTSVYLARKLYAEIFNLTVDDVPQPKSAVMALWTSYPYGAAWYEWNPGYRWGAVETKMLKPSDTDDVFIASNIFSVPWAEGGLDMVEKMLKIL
ncbi:L-amino-acid oxidase-like [Mercenaria mercenaria]|uniref:L-amino-acid oxidase-like n=1 Tax=Mercenaria mercenaria TaxID=6596 RepID=UPI00234F95C0|nr:L-amino-acid oxidase-like [Mercenaria mercenaria]